MKYLGPNKVKALQQLEKLLENGEKKHQELEKKWNELLENETGNCILLNVLYSQISTNEEVTKALKEAIKKVKSEISN